MHSFLGTQVRGDSLIAAPSLDTVVLLASFAEVGMGKVATTVFCESALT